VEDRPLVSRPGRSTPVGATRLTLVRALLGGGATAALLPWIVGGVGGDASACLRLGAAFAVGTLASEVPSAIVGDRRGRARPFLVAAGVAQAIGLVAVAMAASLPALTAAVALLGVGAGLSTGAEGRASLSIGGDARAVARLEVSALLGKGFVACATAIVATLIAGGPAPERCARVAVVLAAVAAVLAAAVASTLRCGDRVHVVPRGRRDARRRTGPGSDERSDRRRWFSSGVVALIAAVAALGLAARGTDTIDAFAVVSHGSGVIAGAAILASKGIVARLLAPHLARKRLAGVALAAFAAALLLTFAAFSTGFSLLFVIALACGLAGGASAAGRGLLLARVGADRAGLAAALEATLRRAAIAAGAWTLAGWKIASATSIGASPYFGAACVACLGGLVVLCPPVIVSLRRRLAARAPADVVVAMNS
jgi:hypothetical protein